MEATILRSTKVARSHLTNHTTLIEQALHEEDTSTYEFQYLVDEFDKKATSLEQAHKAYLNILNDSEIDTAIKEIDKFSLSRQKSKFKVLSKLQSQKVSVSVKPSVQEEDVKLTRLELAHFDGNILNWKPFKESFLIHIHNKSKFSATTKMIRLIGLLEGEAAEMVNGLS